MSIDTSGCYKLFYFLSGNKFFHIDQSIYPVHPGELFFVNQRQYHYFSHVQEQEDHERIVVFIYPDYLKSLSTERTDLCACFSGLDVPSCQRQLTPKDRELFWQLIRKLTSSEGFGEDVLNISRFLELMVFANGVYQAAEIPSSAQLTISWHFTHELSEQLRAILQYIDAHITDPLTLQTLSGQFYLTQSYLCRIFKNGTGTTIHKYITSRRNTLAKDMLTQGCSVTEACAKSGFKDYNSFLKSFVQAVGVSPKKYARFKQ